MILDNIVRQSIKASLLCRSCQEWKATYQETINILSKKDVILRLADGAGIFTQIGKYLYWKYSFGGFIRYNITDATCSSDKLIRIIIFDKQIDCIVMGKSFVKMGEHITQLLIIQYNTRCAKIF